MRHSTAHLAIALCSTMAVSSAPVSPNPNSPALLTPMMTPTSGIAKGNQNDGNTPVSQKRSVGGFAYHRVDQNELERRAVGDPSINDEEVDSFALSDSDNDFGSGSESESDYDIAAASDTEITKRSIPEIWTRSPPPSPLEAKADVSGFDDNASIASADEYMSDDDNMSVASANSFLAEDETSFASEFEDEYAEDAKKSQAKAVEAAPGNIDDAKVEARSLNIGGQSELHGGRNYMSANSWNA